MSLELIQDTVQRVADAITAALELETEIVDNNLMIIGGTGRYVAKIGQFEEDGNTESRLVYAECLKNGNEYITFDPANDKKYDAREGELAEICCPVKIDNDTVGLIGLIAFNEHQRLKLINKTADLTAFLRIMAELIAGELLISRNNLKLQDTISSLLSSSEDSPSLDSIISVSKDMEKVKMRALQVAHSDSTILLTGESGTGKGLLARTIHKESTRADKPFISVNCAAIPEMLLESELFGYEKGAFTGAERSGKPGKFKLADKGTIFLDEIGDMPLHLQAKLLTCLQNRRIDPVGSTQPVDVDVRVIAATNKDLEKMIFEKKFREDLYFRLNVIPIHIPPLRERPKDIDALLDYAIHKFTSRFNKNITGISPEARKVLNSYSWPGNIREIENAIEYAVNMEETDEIQLANLPDNIISNVPVSEGLMQGSLKSQLELAERRIISGCLEETGRTLHGKREAAKLLGISESTLYRRLRALDLL